MCDILTLSLRLNLLNFKIRKFKGEAFMFLLSKDFKFKSRSLFSRTRLKIHLYIRIIIRIFSRYLNILLLFKIRFFNVN